MFTVSFGFAGVLHWTISRLGWERVEGVEQTDILTFLDYEFVPPSLF